MAGSRCRFHAGVTTPVSIILISVVTLLSDSGVQNAVSADSSGANGNSTDVVAAPPWFDQAVEASVSRNQVKVLTLFAGFQDTIPAVSSTKRSQERNVQTAPAHFFLTELVASVSWEQVSVIADFGVAWFEPTVSADGELNLAVKRAAVIVQVVPVVALLITLNDIIPANAISHAG